MMRKRYLLLLLSIWQSFVFVACTPDLGLDSMEQGQVEPGNDPSPTTKTPRQDAHKESNTTNQDLAPSQRRLEAQALSKKSTRREESKATVRSPKSKEDSQAHERTAPKHRMPSHQINQRKARLPFCQECEKTCEQDDQLETELCLKCEEVCQP